MQPDHGSVQVGNDESVITGRATHREEVWRMTSGATARCVWEISQTTLLRNPVIAWKDLLRQAATDHHHETATINATPTQSAEPPALAAQQACNTPRCMGMAPLYLYASRAGPLLRQGPPSPPEGIEQTSGT